MLLRLLPYAAGFAVLTAAANFASAQNVECQQKFVSLREGVDKTGQAIQAANKRKAPLQEACTLFRAYIDAEAKMIKFMSDNKAQCGVPDDVIKNFTKSHAKAAEMRTKVCNAAANGGGGAAAPQSPSSGLSGALSSSGGGPLTDTGSGIFDTMTGNILKQ
jgi:hypothetical protein